MDISDIIADFRCEAQARMPLRTGQSFEASYPYSAPLTPVIAQGLFCAISFRGHQTSFGVDDGRLTLRLEPEDAPAFAGVS